MDSKTFFENFDAIAEAPDGTALLRELILDLAVKGSLTKIEAQQSDLVVEWSVEALKLDAEKIWMLTTCSPHPQSGWSRVPLAKLGSWGSGGTPTATRKEYYSNGTIPWAVIGDLNEALLVETASKITQKALDSSSTKMIPVGAVLIAMYGASIGKVAITGIECTSNQAIAHCIPNESVINSDYLFLLARSLKKHLIAAGKGAAQPNISQTVLKHLVVDIPPLRMQPHIVAQVNHLLELCAELEEELESKKIIVQKLARSLTNWAALNH